MKGHGASDRDLEHRLSEWLRSERVEEPSAVLHERLLGIPQTVAGGRWLSVGPLALAATVVATVVLTVSGVALLRPALPGLIAAPDCDDPRATLQRGLAELNAAEGFRWTEHHQEWTWDPGVEPSPEDPSYAWSGYRAEGSQLRPDRTHWIVAERESDFSGTASGYVEQISIGERVWGRSRTFDPATPARWHDLEGGLVAPPPLVDFRPGDEERYGETELSREVPGQGGCLVTGWIPPSDPPSQSPPEQWTADERLFRFGLRIDDAGRIVGALIERVHSPELRLGDSRTAIEISYEIPAASEFAPPEGPVSTRPPAGHAPPCEDAAPLLEEALSRLQRAAWYQWREHVQLWTFDPEHRPSVSDPRYAWSGHRGEGAYLAPDRMHVVTIEQEREAPPAGVMDGFLEVIAIGEQAWARSAESATPPGWQELPDKVEPNHVYAQLDFLTWASEQVRIETAALTWPVPGDGGCLITGFLANDDAGDDGVQAGAVLWFGLRIDHEQKIVGAAVERRHHPEPEHGDLRMAYQLSYALPDVELFQPPQGPIYSYPPEP